MVCAVCSITVVILVRYKTRESILTDSCTCSGITSDIDNFLSSRHNPPCCNHNLAMHFVTSTRVGSDASLDRTLFDDLSRRVIGRRQTCLSLSGRVPAFSSSTDLISANTSSFSVWFWLSFRWYFPAPVKVLALCLGFLLFFLPTLSNFRWLAWRHFRDFGDPTRLSFFEQLILYKTFRVLGSLISLFRL